MFKENFPSKIQHYKILVFLYSTYVYSPSHVLSFLCNVILSDTKLSPGPLQTLVHLGNWCDFLIFFYLLENNLILFSHFVLFHVGFLFMTFSWKSLKSKNNWLKEKDLMKQWRYNDIPYISKLDWHCKLYKNKKSTFYTFLSTLYLINLLYIFVCNMFSVMVDV